MRRRWLPWRRLSKGLLDWLGLGSPNLGDDPVSAVIGCVVMVLAALVWTVWLGEVVLVALLLPIVMLARIFGAPWVIEVHRSGDGLVHCEAVRGWAASRERIEQIGEALRTGVRDPSSTPTGHRLRE